MFDESPSDGNFAHEHVKRSEVASTKCVEYLVGRSATLVFLSTGTKDLDTPISEGSSELRRVKYTPGPRPAPYKVHRPLADPSKFGRSLYSRETSGLAVVRAASLLKDIL